MNRLIRNGFHVSVCLGLAFSAAALTAPPAYPVTLDREQYLMGTRLQIHLRGEDAARLERASTRVFAEVARLEDVLSNWRPDSEISRLNEGAAEKELPVSHDLQAALEAARRISRWTEGAFDATVEPIVHAYDLRGEGRIPDEWLLLAVLDGVGSEKILLFPSRGTARFAHPATRIDLGGIGKGIALDRAVEILREERVSSGLINFGGEVYALGESGPGSAWEVEIADPTDRQRPVARILVRDAAVSTSGQSERSIEVDGRRIGHIFDPRTGRPVPPWGSVTVVSRSATDADGLSTALFVMGPERARSWMAARSGLAAVLVEREDGEAPHYQLLGQTDSLDGFETLETADLAEADPVTDPLSPPPSNEELARRIDILAGEIEQLKLGEVASPGGSAYGFGPAASKVYHVPQGVSLGGYGEMLYENPSVKRQDGEPSGKTNRIDFLRSIVYVGYKYDERLVFNSEIEFEHASTDVDGSVSVEFANLDYLITRRLNVRAGLLLVPVGITNELHEPPTFLGARRPELEQKIIPTTWRANGAGLFGHLPLGLRYRVYILEGLVAERFADTGIRSARQKGSKALAENLALAGRADCDSGLGLLVGGSIYAGNSGQGLRDSTGAPLDVETMILEGHILYQSRGWRIRALYARATIDNVAQLNAHLDLGGSKSIGERLVGSYVELGYDVSRWIDLPRAFAMIPYVRYETYNTQDSVPAGFSADPANEQRVLTIGAALHPHSKVVLKGDWQRVENETDTGVDQWNLAVGYLF